MKDLEILFERNKAWTNTLKKDNPNFFAKLSEQQAPKYLWIGCSDSRVPANQIVNLPPGEVFVHRNIANVVVHTDLNCLSVMHYAIEVLKVEHVIICGHYDCGGIKASMEESSQGLIENWLRHIKDVSRFNADKLEGLDYQERVDKLCELNVIEQATNVCNSTVIKHAWESGRNVTVHGWIYNIGNGVLKDLKVGSSSIDELNEKLSLL